MGAKLARCAAVVLALAACACAEREVEPRCAVQDGFPEHVRDSFPEQFASSRAAGPPPQREVRSVSLGFIGDSPIGTEPDPPHRVPYWQQPFPCDWTNTCGTLPPVRLYYAPYVGAYATATATGP